MFLGYKLKHQIVPQVFVGHAQELYFLTGDFFTGIRVL